MMHGFGHHSAEIRKDSLRQTFFLIPIMLWSSADALRVTIPVKNMAAAKGHTVVLGCEFFTNPQQKPDISNLVVTWQRKEDNRVVHSFYFETDQLEKQDPLYHNRTALFVKELTKGNASLRLENVRANDAGLYLCTVSVNEDADKAELKLDYGALYTEPRLTVNVNSSGVLMQYETMGFPAPEVKWKGEHGEVLNKDTKISVELNEERGLYYVQSSYMAPDPLHNVTFILRNQLLDQHLHRTFSYTGVQNPCLKVIIALSVVSLLLILTTGTLVGIYFSKKKK
ncbi:CD276 antigen [Tachysurus fulvidraco]|uniref:CD276 antigen n=1 Tax=Tachysurus fulvidraco TaxID=1234273 RepID=UPI000F4F12D2|nr:CD276 antigen [Tachysurus fulvidraco]